MISTKASGGRARSCPPSSSARPRHAVPPEGDLRFRLGAERARAKYALHRVEVDSEETMGRGPPARGERPTYPFPAIHSTDARPEWPSDSTGPHQAAQEPASRATSPGKRVRRGIAHRSRGIRANVHSSLTIAPLPRHRIQLPAPHPGYDGAPNAPASGTTGASEVDPGDPPLAEPTHRTCCLHPSAKVVEAIPVPGSPSMQDR